MMIEHFLCFQAITKFQSFSKAADSLYVSQSALSKKIKSLEDALGNSLFIRKGNNTVTLSPFGLYVSNYIGNIVEDYDILLNAIDNYRLNRQSKLQIATFLNVAHSGLLKPILVFESSQDNFFIETMEKDHSKLKQELPFGQIDVCFGYYELIGDVANYSVTPLFSDPLVLIASKEFTIQQNWGKSINLSDAKNIPFCFPREDMEIFSFLINTCHLHGFIPQLTKSDVRLGTIRQYISAGMRCTMQFESVSRSKFYTDQFEFVSLENAPHLTMSMYVNNSTRKKFKDSFVEHIKSYYAEDIPHS